MKAVILELPPDFSPAATVGYLQGFSVGINQPREFLIGDQFRVRPFVVFTPWDWDMFDSYEHAKIYAQAFVHTASCEVCDYVKLDKIERIFA